jgi:hypothetical protein
MENCYLPRYVGNERVQKVGYISACKRERDYEYDTAYKVKQQVYYRRAAGVYAGAERREKSGYARAYVRAENNKYCHRQRY